MDTKNAFAPSASNHTQNDSVGNGSTNHDNQQPSAKPKSLVPKGITIGLALFALVLSLAGYVFRILIGEEVSVVLHHAAIIVPAFMLGIPLFFWVSSHVLNAVKGMKIESWNAISLGYLTSCIAMLWLMGTYS